MKNEKLLMLVFIFLNPFLFAIADDSISMVVGPSTGSYRVFGLDIAKQALKEGITIEVKESSGDIENVKRLSSHENAAFAIIDEAILHFLQTDPELKFIANKLRILYPFYNAEVHVLGKSSINNFNELDGKKVVVGLQGSGTNFTASHLFELLNIKPIKMYVPFSDGIEMLLKGEIDAVIYVAGKPVPLFNNLVKLTTNNPDIFRYKENIHFIPIENNEILTKAGFYSASITHGDYAIIREDISTVANKNMLISYNFSEENTAYGKNRCEQLKRITKAIRENMDDLKATGHPKWKEIDLDAEIGHFKRSGCVYKVAQDNGLDTVKNCLLNGVCQ